MIKQVKNYIEKMNFINKGDTIAIGVSGGADSVCLLCVLRELYRNEDVHFIVVHVNHNIREEAKEDEDYVETLCNRLSVPFRSFSVDVTKYATQQAISTEEAGRKLRYQAFEEVLKDVNPIHRKIAVAHTMDDNAETMLLNLFRGSGVRGLAGIVPRRGYIIRPLRCVRRKEIEAYLKEKQIPYCTDKTNEEDIYTRNRIRHHILPEAVRQINEKAVEKMNDTSEQILMLEDYIGINVKQAFDECVIRQDNQLCIKEERYHELHPYLQTRLLHYCLQELSGTAKDIAEVHVSQLAQLFTKTTGRGVDLPYGIRAERRYETVVLSIRPRENTLDEPLCKEMNVPGITEIDSLGVIVSTIFDYNKGMAIPKDRYTKWFDYDKIDKALMIRTRQEKDYLVIDDNGNRQKLKSYMINEKISSRLRSQCILVAMEEHVLWLIGYRISGAMKITDDTKKILEIRYLGGDNYGRDNQSDDF